MKKNHVLIFGLIITIFGLGLTTNVSTENELVPHWVKNTAGWWANDKISETEFVNAIEFLVNEGIIHVSNVANGNNNSDSVPHWVKNTAGWWANDKISETEFVNAIEFLVNEGIIQTNVIIYEKTSSTYNSYDEIINDQTLSENQKIIEVDKLLPFYSGYRGAAFDGELVYFAPYYNNHGRHGHVMIYDTSQPFDDKNSWDEVDVYVENGLRGYQGALYSNGHVYFVPYYIDVRNDSKEGIPPQPGQPSGTKVLRYNTEMNAHDLNAWGWVGFFDVYEDGVVDENFVYFSPHLDKNNNYNTFPVRYDTTKDFHTIDGWERFDAKIHGSYIGAASDGEKIYYGPYYQEDGHGSPITNKSTILIYDTNELFDDKNSWEYRSISYGSYGGIGFNGTHVVFAPFCNPVSKENFAECSKIMFLDTNTQKISYSKISHGAYNGVIETKDALYLVPRVNSENIRSDFIQIKNSIETFNPNIGLGGYWGGTYDGRYVYFSPYDIPNSHVRNDEFLRYDTFQPFNNSDSWESISISICDFESSVSADC